MQKTYDFWEKSKGRREPLFRLSELAVEFGVPVSLLRQNIATLSGPNPVFRGNTNAVQHHYYKPSEVRAWWKSLNK